MSTEIQPRQVQRKEIHAIRSAQILGWTVVVLFVLGHFFPLLGAWTGAILGAWFVGTQKPRRGLFWLTLFTFLPALIVNWREFLLTVPEHAVKYVASTFLVAILTALPFFFHRLVSPRLRGFLFTLPLPLAAVVLETFVLAWVPANLHSHTLSQKSNTPLLQIAATFGTGAAAFLIYWFAAGVVRCGTTSFAWLESGRMQVSWAWSTFWWHASKCCARWAAMLDQRLLRPARPLPGFASSWRSP